MGDSRGDYLLSLGIMTQNEEGLHPQTPLPTLGMGAHVRQKRWMHADQILWILPGMLSKKAWVKLRLLMDFQNKVLGTLYVNFVAQYI